MAIRHRLHVEGELLRVVANGRDENLADVMAYALAVIQGAREHGCTRVLCDERQMEYGLDTVDTFKLAEFTAAHAPRVAKVALVFPPRQQQDALFWETVVKNRGLQVRVFPTLELAEAWLGVIEG